jgi:hypothetical protein
MLTALTKKERKKSANKESYIAKEVAGTVKVKGDQQVSDVPVSILALHPTVLLLQTCTTMTRPNVATGDLNSDPYPFVLGTLATEKLMHFVHLSYIPVLYIGYIIIISIYR